MERTFKSLEHEGWNERARLYDDYTARLTGCAIGPLLDAANVRSGARMLDVCCGPGTVSAEAVRRGATVIGVDLSEEMVDVAKLKGTGADFRVGDAEALPFTDQSFDCVTCSFGILHLPEPERGIAEAARVLGRAGATPLLPGAGRTYLHFSERSWEP
jgi:ubiquinone/menaquinone biosynthesis C-methylase UbiE